MITIIIIIIWQDRSSLPINKKVQYHKVNQIKYKIYKVWSLVQKAKRLRVAKKAWQVLKKAEKNGAFYKKQFMQLAKKVIIKGKKGRRPAKKKFNDHSKHHQKRIKKPFEGGVPNYSVLS